VAPVWNANLSGRTAIEFPWSETDAPFIAILGIELPVSVLSRFCGIEGRR
jgi:hypothetical protein